MDTYTLFSIIIAFAVVIAFINHRFFHLQSSIAVMAGAMIVSLVLILSHHFGVPELSEATQHWIIKADLHNLLLNGMLSYLLFAGALNIDLGSLKSGKWEIGILATLSTAISTLIIGTLLFWLLPLFHLFLPYLYCLLFGALISPTDPIAVLATFKELQVSKKLATCVAGEALFNDGVGIVIFITLYQLTFNHIPITWHSVLGLFALQALGGIAYGFTLGFLANFLISKVDDSKLVTLITLAIVSGGYSLALKWGLSGPLAMVVAGIVVGNQIRNHTTPAMRDHINIIWETIDEILNAILFLLVGFELLTIPINTTHLLVALILIPLVLLVRLVTVAIPMSLLQLKRVHEPRTIAILTWGGLRGALALALAFSFPDNGYRNIITTLTYAIVAFSIIVQGYSIRALINKPEKKLPST